MATGDLVTAADLSHRIHSKQVSSVDVMDQTIARIEAQKSHLSL